MSDDWKVLLGLGIVVALVIGCGVLADSIVTQWEAANASAIATCADLGYQKSAEYQDAFFCVTYGLEPRIIRLGTEVELAGD